MLLAGTLDTLDQLGRATMDSGATQATQVSDQETYWWDCRPLVPFATRLGTGKQATPLHDDK